MTITELMLAVSIAIIMTLIASLAYTNWTARADLKGGAAELASTLNLAKMAAMNRNTTTTVSLAMVGTHVQVSTNGLMQPRLLGSHVSGFTGGPIQFSSTGVRQGGGLANQLIVLSSDNGDSYSVVVTPAGKVAWCPGATCP